MWRWLGGCRGGDRGGGGDEDGSLFGALKASCGVQEFVMGYEAFDWKCGCHVAVIAAVCLVYSFIAVSIGTDCHELQIRKLFFGVG